MRSRSVADPSSESSASEPASSTKKAGAAAKTSRIRATASSTPSFPGAPQPSTGSGTAAPGGAKESVVSTPKSVRKKPSTAKKTRKQRPAVGWREWVAIPELGVEAIKAKVDTGAATSALHVTNLRKRETEEGTWLDFVVHPVQRHATPNIATGAWMVAERPVRDSGGRSEVRPVIRTTVELGGQAIQIEITLTRRDNMGFRMLLGRQAIRRRFVVDPGRSFVKRDQKK